MAAILEDAGPALCALLGGNRKPVQDRFLRFLAAHPSDRLFAIDRIVAPAGTASRRQRRTEIEPSPTRSLVARVSSDICGWVPGLIMPKQQLAFDGA